MTDEHPLVQLARTTIERYVRTGELPPLPQDPTPQMKEKAGAFVSLHVAKGELRGCIGTIEPTQSNLAEEVIQNAISAATRDPRFPPVSPEELDGLDISVDVLSEPEPIKDATQLDPVRYGVIVQSEWRRGLLLPNLDGVDTVEHQVEIARRKAGIGANEPISLLRFEVQRFH
jgi:AmmeMemoRadiSam system protein A